MGDIETELDSSEEARDRLQSVILRTSTGAESRGSVTIHEWSRGERMRRAIIWLIVLWAIGAVSIVIPIAHLVLVPLFLLLGPLVAFRVYGQHDMITGGSASCPKCSKTFEIVKAPNQWPLRDVCGSCYQHVTISKG